MNRGLKHVQPGTQLSIAQRRQVVAVNLIAGATYAEIAGTLNISKATITSDYRAILKEWKEHYTAKLDQYLYLQLRRYDVLLNTLWERARSGDAAAIDRALAIMDRQNKLMHITKPGIDLDDAGLVFNIYPASSSSPLASLSMGSGDDEGLGSAGSMLNVKGLPSEV